MLLLGIVTFGMAYSEQVALTNAVREGARLGATADTPSGTPDPWAKSVVDQTVTSYSNSDNPLQADHVCAVMYDNIGAVKHTSDANCDAGTALAGAKPHPPTSPTTCYIMVWAALPTELSWLLGSTTVIQHADSVSIYQRADTC